MVGRDGFLDQRETKVEMCKNEDEAGESSKQWEQKTELATAIVRGDPGNDKQVFVGRAQV